MKIQQEVSMEEIDTLKGLALALIEANDESRVQLIYHRVEKLYTKTNEHGKNLICNRFLLPISSSIELNHHQQKQFLSLLPLELKTAYCKQINHTSL